MECAILDTAVFELNRVGWSLLTMEGVAAGAGAGKGSLYRRWPTKQALVAAALRHGVPSRTGGPALGGLRDELILLAAESRARLASPQGRALCRVLEACRDDDALPFRDLFIVTLAEPVKRRVRELVRRAAHDDAAGPVAPDAGVTDLMVDSLLAALMYPFAEPDLTELVDRVLLPTLYGGKRAVPRASLSPLGRATVRPS